MAIDRRAKGITIEHIEKALRKSGGFIAAAGRMLNVSHANICQRIKRSKRLQAVRKEIEEEHLDIAETKLLKKIKKEENLSAITFYLKTKGKHRGYTEKQEVDIGGQADNPVIYEVEYVSPEDKNTTTRETETIFKPPQKV